MTWAHQVPDRKRLRPLPKGIFQSFSLLFLLYIAQDESNKDPLKRAAIFTFPTWGKKLRRLY